MKILSAEQIKEVEAFTLEKENISSLELMERAAKGFIQILHSKIKKSPSYRVFCGKGNNGGDGLAIARILAESEYEVEVYLIEHKKSGSQDFQTNLNRIKENSSIKLTTISKSKDLEEISEPLENQVTIDALLGIGMNKKVSGILLDSIQKINSWNGITISVDIPSGLFADEYNDPKSKSCIEADFTITFQTPKLAFFFAENYRFTGEIFVSDIGLNKSEILSTSTPYHLTEKKEIKNILVPRAKFSHKGNYGHALLVCGSKGKIGAALLASRACLSSGAGLLTAHIPGCGYQILQSGLPEAMVSCDDNIDSISHSPKLDNFDVVGIGPGIGNEKHTANCLKSIIQNANSPLVLDADALNILSDNKTWISFLPSETILTPHPKEFDRLTGAHTSGYERLQTARKWAMQHELIIVLKGSNTSIVFPDGSVQFNPTGNPSLAKGGTGDVLLGMITGLIARGYKPAIAAILGVYLHGLAGELASSKTSEESVLASDVIQKIGKAFRKSELK